MARESKIGGFIKGAISLAIVAGIGLALFGAGQVIIPALMAGKGLAAGSAILAGATKALTTYGLLAIGGGALLGGAARVVGGIMQDRQEAANYEAEVERAQAMSAPGRGRSRNVDFSGMDSGINYQNNWQERTGRGQSQGAGVGQPTPRF